MKASESVNYLTSSPSSSIERHIVHFSSVSSSSSSMPIFSSRGLLYGSHGQLLIKSNLRLINYRFNQVYNSQILKTYKRSSIFSPYLFILMRKGKPLDGGLHSASVHIAQSVLQLQELLQSKPHGNITWETTRACVMKNLSWGVWRYLVTLPHRRCVTRWTEALKSQKV